MTFAEALMIFCNKYCAMRAMRDQPVYLSEFANGLTVMVIALLDSLDADNRAVLRDAIVAALDGEAVPDKSELN